MQSARPFPTYSAALLTLGAAAIHFAVIPEHWNEFLLYGIFFMCLGVAQVGLAIGLVVAPSRRLYAVALAGTLGVIGLWLFSRTIGMPIGPRPWKPEEINFTDFAATFMEAIACVLFVLRLRRLSPRRRSAVRVALRTAPALLVAPLLAFAGVGGAMSPMPAAYNSAPFIAGQTSVSLASLVAPNGSEPLDEFTLTAAQVAIGGQKAWAYNRTVPGPQLRVVQGDRVKVTLVNHLPVATSIHWHGINVPGSMDGVAGITQDAVAPGRSFTYEFIADEPGTYWYHSHQDAMNQIPKGLVGSIVVEPKGAQTALARDYSLLIHGLPGSDGLAVNGSTNLRLDASPGDLVRLRLTNGAEPGLDLAPLAPVLVGVPYVIAALDGHDLNGPQELGPERIQLGMGQRADLVFRMPNTGAVQLIGIKQMTLPWSSPASPVVTIGNGAGPARVNVDSLPKFDLTRYGVRAPDPVADAGRYDVARRITIGGGFVFRNGSFNIADTFNGTTSPQIPPIRVHEGQLVRLTIVNPTDHALHPIHIHGHVFTLLAVNGHRLQGSPVHTDTVLVGPYQTWDVAFKADNPGIWMLHCHILEHAAAGMSMTINYDGVFSPYTMGSDSGNIPE